jgi:TetR/AcrR family fatty acid metabolism transcriptional regulator
MPRVVDREARREQIISAAASVFAQRGVANAAVSDIVKAAGMAQGTFYLYFAAKDDVVLAVAESFGDHMVAGIEQAVATPERPAVEKLFVLRDMLSDYAASAGVSELVDTMHHPGNRAIHDRLAEHLTPRLVAIVESIVEQGVAERVFSVPDTSAAAWFVLGGLQSVELSGASLAEMPAALAAVTELTLRALGYAGTVA